MEAVWVFLGGGIGAVLRYVISLVTYTPQSGFPIATLLANLLACFILSIVVFSLDSLDPKLKLFLGTGLCGGLSTFSTFSYETVSLMQNGQVGLSILYILISIISCGLIFYGVWWWSVR